MINFNSENQSPHEIIAAEVIQAHKEFWEYKIGSKELENSILDEGNLIVPDLELYIVNLWHFDDKVVPCDPDGITERHQTLNHMTNTM